MPSTSFTERILAELAPHTPPLSCCRAALIEGMRLAGDGDAVVTARSTAARAALAALHAEGVAARVERLRTPRHHHFRVVDGPPGRPSERSCCRRSRLRGAFLAAGSLTRADGAPHLELWARDEAGAERLREDLEALEVPARVQARRGRAVVTVRSVTGVATALSLIGAQSGRLEFEEGRVVREVRGDVSRRLNAETANLRRTVEAAVSQLEAIEALRTDPAGWDALPHALREAGELRLRHPRETLDRLAARAGCSRGAMAGRLHRLVGAAASAAGQAVTRRG